MKRPNRAGIVAFVLSLAIVCIGVSVALQTAVSQGNKVMKARLEYHSNALHKRAHDFFLWKSLKYFSKTILLEQGENHIENLFLNYISCYRDTVKGMGIVVQGKDGDAETLFAIVPKFIPIDTTPLTKRHLQGEARGCHFLPQRPHLTCFISLTNITNNPSGYVYMTFDIASFLRDLQEDRTHSLFAASTQGTYLYGRSNSAGALPQLQEWNITGSAGSEGSYLWMQCDVGGALLVLLLKADFVSTAAEGVLQLLCALLTTTLLAFVVVSIYCLAYWTTTRKVCETFVANNISLASAFEVTTMQENLSTAIAGKASVCKAVLFEPLRDLLETLKEVKPFIPSTVLVSLEASDSPTENYPGFTYDSRPSSASQTIFIEDAVRSPATVATSHSTHVTFDTPFSNSPLGGAGASAAGSKLINGIIRRSSKVGSLSSRRASFARPKTGGGLKLVEEHALAYQSVTVLLVRMLNFDSIVTDYPSGAHQMHTEFVETVEAAIKSHKGQINHFTSDWIIGSFNAATRVSQHAMRGVVTALEITKAFKTHLQPDWRSRGDPVLFPQVVVVSGNCLVGMLGSNTLKTVDILGNLLSRLFVLDAAATNLERSIIIDESTNHEAQSVAISRCVDVISVNNEAQRVFEVTSSWESVTGSKSGAVDVCEEWMYQIQNDANKHPFLLYGQAFTAFLKGSLVRAQDLIAAFLVDNPNDMMGIRLSRLVHLWSATPEITSSNKTPSYINKLKFAVEMDPTPGATNGFGGRSHSIVLHLPDSPDGPSTPPGGRREELTPPHSADPGYAKFQQELRSRLMDFYLQELSPRAPTIKVNDSIPGLTVSSPPCSPEIGRGELVSGGHKLYPMFKVSCWLQTLMQVISNSHRDETCILGGNKQSRTGFSIQQYLYF